MLIDPAASGRSGSQPHANFTLGEVLGGLHYLEARPTDCVASSLLVTFFGVVGMGYEAMIPAYTRRVVGGRVSTVTASCWRAAASARRSGAFVVASLGEQRRKERWVDRRDGHLRRIPGRGGDAPDVAGSSGGTSRVRLAAAAVCLLGAGFGAVVFYSSAQTMIQLAVRPTISAAGSWASG